MFQNNAWAHACICLTVKAGPQSRSSSAFVGSHVTRFIGLADVGNTGKQKWVHALGMQPASEMDAEILQQKPARTTACPFTASQKRPAETQANGQVGPPRHTPPDIRHKLEQQAIRKPFSDCMWDACQDIVIPLSSLEVRASSASISSDNLAKVVCVPFKVRF